MNGLDFYQVGPAPLIKIPLTQNKMALIDASDYERISKYKWHAHYEGNGRYYAITHEPKSRNLLRMHRLIINSKKGELVDHINGDGLDNRRCNLRIVTNSQNMMNQKKTRGISEYKGVTWQRFYKKWEARIQSGGKTIHLGMFDTEVEAAHIYDKTARNLFGDYARLNFPKGGFR